MLVDSRVLSAARPFWCWWPMMTHELCQLPCPLQALGVCDCPKRRPTVRFVANDFMKWKDDNDNDQRQKSSHQSFLLSND